MALDGIVIGLIKQKTGYPVDTPAGAERLMADIEKETGERISINTIKRLTGVIDYEGRPRTYTLDIVARFIGFESWKKLHAYTSLGTSEFKYSGVIIEVKRTPVGTIFELTWAPDRTVRLQHLGDSYCRVIESINSKLAVDDILSIWQIAPGFPLLADSVTRDGINLGHYTAATDTGLTSMKILQD